VVGQVTSAVASETANIAESALADVISIAKSSSTWLLACVKDATKCVGTVYANMKALLTSLAGAVVTLLDNAWNDITYLITMITDFFVSSNWKTIYNYILCVFNGVKAGMQIYDTISGFKNKKASFSQASDLADDTDGGTYVIWAVDFVTGLICNYSKFQAMIDYGLAGYSGTGNVKWRNWGRALGEGVNAIGTAPMIWVKSSSKRKLKK